MNFMKMVYRQMIPSRVICNVSHSSGFSLVTNWCCLLVVLMLRLIIHSHVTLKNLSFHTGRGIERCEKLDCYTKMD